MVVLKLNASNKLRKIYLRNFHKLSQDLIDLSLKANVTLQRQRKVLHNQSNGILDKLE